MLNGVTLSATTMRSTGVWILLVSTPRLIVSDAESSLENDVIEWEAAADNDQSMEDRWSNIQFRYSSLSYYAAKLGFDPLVAQNWYSVSLEDALQDQVWMFHV